MSHPRKVLEDKEIIRSTVPPREVLHMIKAQCHPHQMRRQMWWRVHTFSRPINCKMQCQMDLFSGRDVC